MNILVAIGASAFGIAAVVAFFVRRRTGARSMDLGEVSGQWLVEHRAGAGHDVSRWNNR
jgi:hypothetical protein